MKKGKQKEVSSLVDVIYSVLMRKKETDQCLVVLEFLSVLLENHSQDVIGNQSLKEEVLQLLKHESDEIVERTLQVLVLYSQVDNNLLKLIEDIVMVLVMTLS